MSLVQSQNKQIEQERQHPLKVYLWVLSFVKPYYVITILLILAGVIVSGGELIIPKVIQYFIDVVYPAGDYRGLVNLCVILFMIIIAVILSSMAMNLLQRTLSEKAARDLRFAAFRKTRELGIPYYEHKPAGQIISLLNNEVSALQEIYKTYMPTTIQFFIHSVLSLAIMVSISLKLSLIIIPVFILYYLLGPYFARKAVVHGMETANCSIQLNKQIYDSVSALQEIRANGNQDWDITRHSKRVKLYLNAYLKTNLFSFLRGSVRRFCNNLGAVGIFAYGSILARTGELTVGGFVVFVLTYFYTIFVITKIVSLATEQRQVMFQGEKLYNLLKFKPSVKESSNPVTLQNIKGFLSFNQVYFGYSMNKPILKNFNLEIQVGEKIVLVGTSGGGKSTIIKLAVRFYNPWSGTITLDGVPLKDLRLSQVREAMGCVFQETYLFGKSIRDNIRFGNPNASEEEIVAAAKAASAHEFILGLPKGYDTLVGERGIKLSGGQRQRISIARMFIKNPPVILLDEATSALDNINEKEVQDAFDRLMRGRTTIIVSHRLTTIRNANRIVVLDEGEIYEQGTYEELMDIQGKFYKLVNGNQVK
ncbi:ABC transporter ATP-binding protein [Paenibacillus woosongensis]|uniref:ABC transporter ATP-binding protein n=1 Tax=Paenibacillus woosongensis TaxID=307580 RepID=A0ABQ4MLE4_9BACL|nr:ABC transporter ATP-binding protein [Paenibacillus woosongensis]GIP56759.1 ABC transporter ATP-binding protein [Paenibacillus woosongensis]